MDETPFSFETEWYDEEAAMKRSFRMLYFPISNKIQLFEPRTQKMFLRKTTIDGIQLGDMFVGNTLLILSRMFSIKDYADEYTRTVLSRKSEKTFAMLKPDAVKYMGESIQTIDRSGLKILSATMAVMTEMQASYFYQEHTGKTYFPTLLKYVTSGPVLAMELQGEDAVNKWRKLIGPTNPLQAVTEDPTCLRARFGTNKTYNGYHGSDSTEAALREISIFFPGDRASKEYTPQSSATFKNCTCCIIKPHAFHEGKLGLIISAIQAGGFNISALELVRFDRASAAEFHEIYDGVVLEYTDMVTQLQSGPSVALEITPVEKVTMNGHDESSDQSDDGNHHEDKPFVKIFRELVGPMDPEVARKIRPNSLRAKFGKTKVLNAIHCTDLAMDGVLEVEYVFKILKQK